MPESEDEEIPIECIEGGNEEGCEEDGPAMCDGGYLSCPLV